MSSICTQGKVLVLAIQEPLLLLVPVINTNPELPKCYQRHSTALMVPNWKIQSRVLRSISPKQGGGKKNPKLTARCLQLLKHCEALSHENICVLEAGCWQNILLQLQTSPEIRTRNTSVTRSLITSVQKTNDSSQVLPCSAAQHLQDTHLEYQFQKYMRALKYLDSWSNFFSISSRQFTVVLFSPP